MKSDSDVKKVLIEDGLDPSSLAHALFGGNSRSWRLFENTDPKSQDDPAKKTSPTAGISKHVVGSTVNSSLKTEMMDAGEVKGVGTAKVSITMGVDVGVGDHTWEDRIIAVTDLSGMADVLGKHMTSSVQWIKQVP